MRRRLVATSLLFALSLSGALVGCKGNSLDGKWNVSGVQGMPAGMKATYEFGGGNVTMNLNANIPDQGEMKIVAKGSYTVQGEKLTVSVKDVQIDDSKIINPMAKAFFASPQGKATLEKGLKENTVYTVKWDSSDQVLLTGKQGAATLTRVK